jgi:hypothetical protein
MGCMKLTDAPPSTQSISTSESAGTAARAPAASRRLMMIVTLKNYGISFCPLPPGRCGEKQKSNFTAEVAENAEDCTSEEGAHSNGTPQQAVTKKL